MLPRAIARKRAVERCAQYMHEHGEPQYAPDEGDNAQTCPRGSKLAAVASALRRAELAAPSLPAPLDAAATWRAIYTEFAARLQYQTAAAELLLRHQAPKADCDQFVKKESPSLFENP